MEDEEGYMTLKLPSSRPIRTPNHRLCPRWHRTVLLLSCAGNVVLTVAVIRVGVYGLGSISTQQPAKMAGENERNNQSENVTSFLRKHLCEAAMAPADNGLCRVCPLTWLLHQDKCYWVSNHIQSWIESYRDCLAKRSQLLVISNTREKTFFQNATNDKKTWIGFSFKLPEKKWMWIDGSPFNESVPQDSKTNCGLIGKKGFDSDLCSIEHRWICQKEPVFI